MLSGVPLLVPRICQRGTPLSLLYEAPGERPRKVEVYLMPTYMYQCERCNEMVEISTVGYNSTHSRLHCDVEDTYCDGILLRRWRNENPNVVYRSTGFYATDKRFDRNEDDE